MEGWCGSHTRHDPYLTRPAVCPLETAFSYCFFAASFSFIVPGQVTPSIVLQMKKPQFRALWKVMTGILPLLICLLITFQRPAIAKIWVLSLKPGSSENSAGIKSSVLGIIKESKPIFTLNQIKTWLQKHNLHSHILALQQLHHLISSNGKQLSGCDSPVQMSSSTEEHFILELLRGLSSHFSSPHSTKKVLKCIYEGLCPTVTAPLHWR